MSYNRRWTKEEDEILLESYGKCNIETLAKRLNRKPRALTDRLWKIEGTYCTSSISGNFKTTDIAEIMGVSLVTVHSWIKKKQIPYIKPNSHYLIIESSFWNWLKNNLNKVNFLKIDDSIELIVPDWYQNEIKINKRNHLKVQKGKQRIWTTYEETTAWDMFVKGFSSEEVGVKLGRTAYSVNHKIRLIRQKKMGKVG